MLIPQGDICFVRDNLLTHGKVYAIRSPVTQEWMQFEISIQAFSCMRELNLGHSDILAYYQEQKILMAVARRFQPFRDDMLALCDDEAKKFHARRQVYNKIWT